MSDSRARAVAEEPYARWLGVRTVEIGGERARIELPYKDENSNPGRQVHGGVVASALAIAGRMAAVAALDVAEPRSASTLSVSVGYLASAVGEAIVSEGHILRRGKELCYVGCEATNPEGKPLGTALVVYRAAPWNDPEQARYDVDRSSDGIEGLESIGTALTAAPFIAGVGMVPEQMKDGRSRLRLKSRDTNVGADDAIHEGAISALLDTCGSLAAWSLVKPQRGMRVSTVGIEANFVNPIAGGKDLIARGRMVGRKREIFFNRVDIESSDGVLAAFGTVIYRIVLPEET